VSRCSALVVVLMLGAGAAQAQQPPPGASAFALHAGPAYATVPDAAFETVATLSGQELFAQTDARESVVDFGVFVSQRLWAADPAGARVYATLGTGVSRPGRLLFFGGSVGASRALLTVGLATSLVETGVQPAPDLIFRGDEERTLFGNVEHNREWGVFVAVSFALIQ
jgi:hypothetical protein